MNTFQWKDFVDVADELCNKNNEASIRCALSRYYYAAFGHSREYLTDTLKEHQYVSGEDIHSRVLNRFEDSSFDEENIISDPLDRLRKSRINADYDKKLRKHNMSIIKKETKFVLDKVDKLNQNPVHPPF